MLDFVWILIGCGEFAMIDTDKLAALCGAEEKAGEAVGRS